MMRTALAGILAVLLLSAPLQAADDARQLVAIGGTVIAANGDIATFREDDGTTVPIDESSLRALGAALTVGAHYLLRGYWKDDMFTVRSSETPANTSASPSVASVQGIITAIDGSRVTILQGLFDSVTVDDHQAVSSGAAANLSVGRSITAYGYWNGSTFYATSIG